MKRASAVLLLNPLVMHVMASFADESTGQGTSATNRPNIIIMQPDDLQFFDEWSPPPNNPYTPNRQVSLPTNGLPNIDSLRLNGLQMKQAYTASPMCGTSRYSTITGKYPSRAATVRENANYYDYEEGEPGLVTIPTTKLEDVDGMNDCSKDNIAVQFQNNGYRTAMIGKWHLSRIDDDSYTYESAVEIVKGCGFDTVDGLYVENMVADPDSFNNYSDGTFSHNMEWITYEAVQFIESDDEEPFFLYFNPTVPHGSQDVGVALRDFTCQDTANGNLGFDPVIPGMTEEYGSCADYRNSIFDRADTEEDYGPIWLDDSVGAIIKALEDKGILGNTIFLFQMDHGMETKGALYENGVRIPQFIHYPSKFSPGTTFNAPVSTIDIGATMLDFAGIVPSYELDGMSWKDVVGNTEASFFWENHRCIFFELQKDRAARCGCHKYLSIFEQLPRSSGTFRRGDRHGLSNDLANFFDLCGGSTDYVTEPTTSMEAQNMINENKEVAKEIQSLTECHLQRSDYSVDPDYSPCNLFRCKDSPFAISRKNGKSVMCDWVAKGNTRRKCRRNSVLRSHCPKTCNDEEFCLKDAERPFRIGSGNFQDCTYFETDSTDKCLTPGVSDTCRKTCSQF